MDVISNLFSMMSELVPLGATGAIIGIFLFSAGVFIEAKTTRKFGRAAMLVGFLILFAAIYESVG